MLETLLDKTREVIIASKRSMFIISALNSDDTPLWIVTNDPKSGTALINLPKQSNGSLAVSGSTLEEALQKFLKKNADEK